MPGLRKCLQSSAVAVLAIFAPLFSLAVNKTGPVPTRRRLPPSAIQGAGVIAFAPRRKGILGKGEPRPEGGAVILAFRQRSAPLAALDEPPALAGSR